MQVSNILSGTDQFTQEAPFSPKLQLHVQCVCVCVCVCVCK